MLVLSENSAVQFHIVLKAQLISEHDLFCITVDGIIHDLNHQWRFKCDILKYLNPA